jgi:cytochrome c556
MLIAGGVQAQDGPSLKVIMVGLEADMEMIVRAMNYDDFEAIRTKAMEIAEHDKPPMAERKKIMAFLGAEASEFRKGDAMVHSSAVKLAEAALEKDYEKVVDRYKILLGGCVACHTGYRSRIVEHLKEVR